MDEADRMLDQDFGPLLDKILRILPAKRNTFLFSATLSSKVESLQRASLSNPEKVSVSSKYSTVKTLQSYYLLKPHKWKDLYLCFLLNEFMGWCPH
jgi:ATP-dependent RNA helicase DDX47/RRP3